MAKSSLKSSVGLALMCAVLGTEPMALQMLGRCSANWGVGLNHSWRAEKDFALSPQARNPLTSQEDE